MNTTIALVKKELHTAKWFLLGGILFFWSFPLLEGFGTYYRSGAFRTEMPSSMAVAFGALFAIITAGGIVCLDMPKGLYEFWRSRPIQLLPYMAVKYLTGLAVILFVVTMPLLLEMYVMRNVDSMYMASNQGCILYIHSCVIILIYSMTFFTGHILRNMTETVIISCAGLLLVYIVPVLIPALESLSFFSLLNYNVSDVQNGSQLFFYVIRKFWVFMGASSILSAVLIVGTWICLKRHVQFRLGLKVLCWCQGLLSLILFSAAAFSVGSNLQCLAISSLLADKTNDRIDSCFDEKGGVMFRGHYAKGLMDYDTIQIDRITEEPSYVYKHESYLFEMSIPRGDLYLGFKRIAWSRQNPDIVYFYGSNKVEQKNVLLRKYSLYIIKLDSGSGKAQVLNELPLGEHKRKENDRCYKGIAIDDQKLYIQLPNEIVIFDISNEGQPVLVENIAYQDKIDDNRKRTPLTFQQPSHKTLSREQQQCMVQNFCLRYRACCWQDDRYVEAVDNMIRVYKIDNIKGTEIHMQKITEITLLPLEKLMQGPLKAAQKVILNQDTIFVLDEEYRLTVYQLNESAGTLKRVGHYAAPEGHFTDMFLRDDGNIALVGASQIHIVQPPAGKKN